MVCRAFCRSVAGFRALAVFVLTVWVLAAAPARAEPALWKVEGGPADVWLFGTFHLLPEDAEWFSGKIEQAFAASDVLVVEVDLSDPAQIGQGQVVASKYAWASEDAKLLSLLNETEAEALGRLGSEVGMPLDVLNQYRPWFAGIMLTVGLMQKLGYSPDAGADQTLLNKAQARGMQIQGFETAGEQVEFLALMPDKLQLDMLRATLRDVETIPQMMDDMFQAWISGNAEEIGALLNGSMQEYPEAYDRLLVARNRNWIPQIEKMIADQNSYFIAVGTGHLVDENSVVDLLRQKGYRVERP